MVCVQVLYHSYSYILFAHIIGYYPSTEYDLIKCMLTLSNQSYIASYTPAIILSINILLPFFRHKQDIVRQGIYEAIKFHESPKWCKFCNFCGICFSWILPCLELNVCVSIYLEINFHD